MDEEEINRMEIKEVIKNIKVGKGWNTGQGNMERRKWRSGYENFVIRYGRKKGG